MANPKLEFLAARLKRKHPVLVYVAENNGTVSSFTVDPSKSYTLSGYGFVSDTQLKLDSAWTPWRKVFHMVCRDDHCIDWSTIPRSVLDGCDRDDMQRAYRAYASNVIWCNENVSTGTKPKFTWQMPKRPAVVVRGRLLPRGWRVIEGGRA